MNEVYEGYISSVTEAESLYGLYRFCNIRQRIRFVSDESIIKLDLIFKSRLLALSSLAPPSQLLAC